MRREERVTVQGPVKEQQPDGMSHRGWLGAIKVPCLGGQERCGLPDRRTPASGESLEKARIHHATHGRFGTQDM